MNDNFEAFWSLYKAIALYNLQQYDSAILKSDDADTEFTALADVSIHAQKYTYLALTVSKFHNHIRQAIINAVEEKIILFDFTQNIVILGTQNIKKAEDKFLSYDDTQKVISYFKERLDPKIPSYYMINLAFTTGLRYSELLGLTWEDIDFQNNLLYVKRSYDYHNHTDMKKQRVIHQKEKFH